jgi:hypothetical protein
MIYADKKNKKAIIMMFFSHDLKSTEEINKILENL